jgi:uncharacterized membrane protein
MTDAERIFVVDRIEGGLLVLVADDDAATHTVRRSDLPSGCDEGAVLRVPIDSGGQPQWSAAVVDEALRRERFDAMRKQLDRLKGRDPGGDVTL